MSPAAKSARVSAGVPTGGQFAAHAHAESDVQLSGAGTPGAGTTGAQPAPVKAQWRNGNATVTPPPPLPDDEFFAGPDADFTAFDPTARKQLMDSLRTPSRAQGQEFRGAKFTTRNRPAADIAKDIRGDLKAAQDSGALPAGVKFSVVTNTYSGGQSIDVTVKNLPDQDAFEMNDDHRHVTLRSSVAGEELHRTVDAIRNAYQRDGSDSMSDHFDVEFYGSTRIESESAADSAQMEKIGTATRKARHNPLAIDRCRKAMAAHKRRSQQRDDWYRSAEDAVRTLGGQ